MAGDRPIDPPSDPLDSFIEEAEARWDKVFTNYEKLGRYQLPTLVTWLIADGFSTKILEDAIIDQCYPLIQDLAERLYSEANSTKGYD